MYVFAVLALFSLGVYAITMLADRYVTAFREFWVAVAMAFGIGLAWVADLDMWSMWGLHVREGWIGVTLTGIALTGFAFVWREVLGYVAGLERKTHDEAQTIEQTNGIRRAA